MKKIVAILLVTLLTAIGGCASYESVAFMRGSDIAAADQAPDQKQYADRLPMPTCRCSSRATTSASRR